MSGTGRRSFLQRRGGASRSDLRRGTGSSTSGAKEAEPAAPSHALVTVLNNPAEYNYLKFLGLSKEAWDLAPPPLAPGLLPDVSVNDFQPYLDATSREYRRYENARQSEADQKTAELLAGNKPSQGEGLIQAMRQVPAMFFTEEFSLARPEVWAEVCPEDSEEDRAEALEQLLQFLDTVETYLLQEISSRSDQFMEAAAGVQDLRNTLHGTYTQVAALRKEVQGLDEGAYEASARIQQLQRRRANLTALLSRAKAMEEVAVGQAALELMLPQSAAVAPDFGGALDVLEDMAQAMESGELDGISAFRQLPEQVGEVRAVLDEMMASDFLERARLQALPALVEHLQAWVETGAGTGGGAGAGAGGDAGHRGPLFRITSDADADGSFTGNSALQQQVLASLEEGSAAAAGTCNRMVPPEVDEAATYIESNREEVSEFLLPLVLGMHRSGRLASVLSELREAAAAQVKEAARDLLSGVLNLSGDDEGGGGPFEHGRGRPGSSGGGNKPPSVTRALQELSDAKFLRLLESLQRITQVCLSHYAAATALVRELLPATKPSRQQVAALAAECSSLLQGVADAAQARWSKLLTARASSAGSGSVDTLRSVVGLTDALMACVEGHGLRPGAPLRSALQAHCKAVVDAAHGRLLTQLTAIMQQERWTAVPEVPQDVQEAATAILEAAKQLEEQCGGVASAAEPQLQRSNSSSGGGAKPHTNGKNPRQHQVHANGASEAAAAAASGGLPPRESPSRPGSPDLPPAVPLVSARHAEGEGSGEQAAAAADGDSQAAAAAAAGAEAGGAMAGGGAGQPGSGDAQQQQGGGGGGGPAEQQGGGSSSSLALGDRRFPVVHCCCVLVRMVQTYKELQEVAPSCAPEVARRVVEMLKMFNSRSCQLVLGAGAMQLSGLRSITAKHLALTAQCLDALMALMPHLTAVFTLPVQQPRRALLTPEFDRVLQDLKVHRDEILGKLVAIMRDRLASNLKQLPALAEGWAAAAVGGTLHQQPGPLPPTQFAQSIGKQLAVLRGVLSPLLQEEELYYVFGKVGGTYSKLLADGYQRLDPRSGATGPSAAAAAAGWQAQARADLEYYIEALHGLPINPAKLESKLLHIMHVYYSHFQTMMRQRSASSLSGGSRRASVESLTALAAMTGGGGAGLPPSSSGGGGVGLPPSSGGSARHSRRSSISDSLTGSPKSPSLLPSRMHSTERELSMLSRGAISAHIAVAAMAQPPPRRTPSIGGGGSRGPSQYSSRGPSRSASLSEAQMSALADAVASMGPSMGPSRSESLSEAQMAALVDAVAMAEPAAGTATGTTSPAPRQGEDGETSSNGSVSSSSCIGPLQQLLQQQQAEEAQAARPDEVNGGGKPQSDAVAALQPPPPPLAAAGDAAQLPASGNGEQQQEQLLGGQQSADALPAAAAEAGGAAAEDAALTLGAAAEAGAAAAEAVTLGAAAEAGAAAAEAAAAAPEPPLHLVGAPAAEAGDGEASPLPLQPDVPAGDVVADEGTVPQGAGSVSVDKHSMVSTFEMPAPDAAEPLDNVVSAVGEPTPGASAAAAAQPERKQEEEEGEAPLAGGAPPSE